MKMQDKETLRQREEQERQDHEGRIEWEKKMEREQEGKRIDTLNAIATDFVNKYPNLFTEDKDFWIAEIENILNVATISQFDPLVRRRRKATAV
jgi:hypothetical protein